ncbi:ADP compounds hydrolase [Lysobacter enzymogenes]|uniref:ADP compounds hydrolase n=1 Tax=Lysobacter enzymogenes TaxID=69 RepID=A0A0S2DL52_LYSEN|nr:ADP compounds hydrolase [Lysobacter enzymogenes]QCW27475.1 ADP compounds hydrolase NudE [Lysobacter enzymogenes]QQQ02566.1 ADP compounds hydrolase NudE [Lysobacter enzymogenes]
MSRRLPIVHNVVEHDASGYRMESLDLEFSNGERRRYERLLGRPRAAGPGAVIVVPMLDDETVLLVREYAAGVHRYELGLVKGRIDAGESAVEAADRELKEEAGYGARSLTVLRSLSLAPTYMIHQAYLVLARDLYPERLPGDEPEELDVIPWKLDRLHELILREDFSEGRSIAALFIAREWLRHGEPAPPPAETVDPAAGAEIAP